MKQRTSRGVKRENVPDPTYAVLEEVMDKKFCDITTLLYSTNGGKSRLYETCIALVERSLFKIALQRNNNVKGAAAAYLGINRNTFQKKMAKLGMDNQRD